MNVGFRIRRSMGAFMQRVGKPTSTEGERYHILEQSQSPTTSASNNLKKRNSSPDVFYPHKPEESNFSFCNTDFNSSSNSLSKSNGLLQNGQNSIDSEKSVNLCSERLQNEREINITRTSVDIPEVERKYGFVPEENLSYKVKRAFWSRCVCNLTCFISVITSLFPVLKWLPQYRLQYLVPDVIAGFTISILHIPQGMAYGMLASLKAENGLYVSFFPVFIYFIFGTSRHISIGTFAVISLMVSSAIDKSHTVPFREFNNTSNATDLPPIHTLPPTHLEMATTLCILVGCWQLLMGIFRLGSLSVVLSDQLVSGFSTGAAVHVATSQLYDLFGISVDKHDGFLKLIYVYEDIFEELKFSNVATIIISAISIFLLALVKEQVNERFKDKLIMPIPVELGIVVLATTVSYFMDFKDTYNVKVIGEIPTGLPQPSLPFKHLIPELLTESFAIAIVIFVISLSMAKIFSKKYSYEINASQELIALGSANIISSFFACYPCSTSLSRSLIQERSGGKTQVAGIVSCGILLLVLLVLAPLFYTLPRCILSSVILVALKGMFLQVKDFFRAWKVSKTDALIWLVTFLCTVLLGVSYGLLSGVIFSLFTVVFRTVRPAKAILGNVRDTDLYLDVQRFTQAEEIKGLKIFRFQSALYFMNKEHFKNSLQRCVPLQIHKEDGETDVKQYCEQVHYIIVDCSSFSYVDISGLDILIEVMKEYSEVGVTVFLAGCSVTICDVMDKADFYLRMPEHSAIYPTIHDAVQRSN